MGWSFQSPHDFRWTIDQLAVLKPADLEERPLQQDTLNIMSVQAPEFLQLIVLKSGKLLFCVCSKDPAEEAKKQQAIDAYFDAGNVTASPWTENVRRMILSRTPGICSAAVASI